VEEQQKTQEQLKTEIYSIYSNFLSEDSFKNQQEYFKKICEPIYIWCKDYLYKKETNEMGAEITEIVDRLLVAKNVPNNKNGFFGYLVNRLYEAKLLYYRDRLSEPVKKSRKINEIKQVLKMKESNIGRKLTEDERIRCLSEWYKWDEKKSKNWLKALDRNFVSGFELGNDSENKESDVLETEVTSPYIPNISIDPQIEYEVKHDTQIFYNAVEAILQDAQDRSRECYRSLFTGYCIGKYKDFEFLSPLLDNELLEAFQSDGKKPKQYEIYLKYHHVEKGSAEARASQMLKDFLKTLKTYLKQKAPESFH
jgi:predicted Holliday junction resolvase-like endonuclease